MFSLALCGHIALTAAAAALPVSTSIKVSLLTRLFQYKLGGLFVFLVVGVGSLLCFGLMRCLVSKQLLMQCCNSVTEDHSIVFLVLRVAVFNKPLDYPY